MSELVDAARSALRTVADPERAPRQQAYMRSAMPFHGVGVPQARAVARGLVESNPFATAGQWREGVAELWDAATHREERYVAIGLIRHRTYRRWATEASTVDLLRRLIVDGAWWDLVDELSHCVGDLLRARPDTMTGVIRAWALDEDLWLRRAAIICQLGFQDETDLDLLSYAIAGSLDDEDFFARKAIGWALRDYARTDAEWVRRLVDQHRGRLSPLSVREALKHLG